MFNSVAIVSRTDRVEAIELAKEISLRLENRGIEVKFEEGIADKLNVREKTTRDFAIDLMITIGGDGTVLRAFHITNGRVPIFPIRMGTVGFLCDADWESAFKALDKLLRGEYLKDECFTLQSNFDTPLALNEFRVGVPPPTHTVEVEIYVDEFLIAKDKLDGVIISTSAGASGYALSAGANIIDPRLEAITIVPICALSTSFKPYVVPSISTIKIKPINESELTTLVDGSYQNRLSGVREVKIRKSQTTVTILRTGWNFYERLKRRLNIDSTK
nr:NAD(+)/NADH kinase [Candidatus Njordarchaeota archaeon]